MSKKRIIEELKRILEASFKGCESDCLHCGEVNSIASELFSELNCPVISRLTGPEAISTPLGEEDQTESSP